MSAWKKPLASSPGSTSPAASETKKVLPSSTVRLPAIDLEYSHGQNQCSRTPDPHPRALQERPTVGPDSAQGEKRPGRSERSPAFRDATGIDAGHQLAIGRPPRRRWYGRCTVLGRFAIGR